jgi:hypothetical protein
MGSKSLGAPGKGEEAEKGAMSFLFQRRAKEGAELSVFSMI